MYQDSYYNNDLRLFNFEGRIGRLVYFLFSFVIPSLFFWVFASLAGFVSRFNIMENALAYALLALSVLLVIVLIITLTVKRLHDIEWSGWIAALVILFPPLVIFLWLIPGTVGSNNYGEELGTLPKIIFWMTPVLYIILAIATYYFVSQYSGVIMSELARFFAM